MKIASDEKDKRGRFDLITKRGIFWLALSLLAGLCLGARLVLRYVYDRQLDAPNRFEQVVWMNSAWGERKELLRVWLSHLGKPAPGRSKVMTQLIGISNADRAMALTELERSYLRFSPTNITSDNLYVTIAPAKKFKSLEASFEALAAAGYASRRRGTFGKPVIYSFAIRAQLENSRKVFYRTYHFRSWAPVETMFLWLSLFIGIYLITTLSIRGVTALVGKPRRPIDLLQDWIFRLWITVRIWWLRYVVCKRIANSFRWVAAGLGMLAAIAGLNGAQNVQVTGLLSLFAALASIMELVAAGRTGQLEALRKMVEEMKDELQNKKEVAVEKILQQRAWLISEFEKTEKICRELDPEALPEIEQKSRAAYAGLHESLAQLRSELERVHRQETERRTALKTGIAEKIEAARRDIAGRVLAYLQSEDFHSKIPVFDAMVSEEEFEQKVRDPELVFQGERKGEWTQYKLISLRPQINSELGEPLLVLEVTKEGQNFRLRQFVDKDHPAKVITLQLEKRPGQEVAVKFEVHFDTLVVKPESLPAADKIPVSLANPEPSYSEWFAPLQPLKHFLQASRA
ncbi:MAG: hypothetical protein ONB44_00065 [candidate division KSB1 bacterium]|nr:hypothetical protein [candidate division KSB1 bacterium]MDZ7300516.1 hypothetical protein [candidate division KSB1 bacterium]MDZ7309655.1 hypothetical protein [candidate division KSB1 bacterium]